MTSYSLKKSFMSWGGSPSYPNPLSHLASRPLSFIGYLTFQRNNFTGRVHDGRVSRDGPSDGIGRVVQVNDDHLRLVPNLLPDADELVRLHGQ